MTAARRTLTDADVAAIADAVADRLARRARPRKPVSPAPPHRPSLRQPPAGTVISDIAAARARRIVKKRGIAP